MIEQDQILGQDRLSYVVDGYRLGWMIWTYDDEGAAIVRVIEVLEPYRNKGIARAILYAFKELVSDELADWDDYVITDDGQFESGKVRGYGLTGDFGDNIVREIREIPDDVPTKTELPSEIALAEDAKLEEEAPARAEQLPVEEPVGVHEILIPYPDDYVPEIQATEGRNDT